MYLGSMVKVILYVFDRQYHGLLDGAASLLSLNNIYVQTD